MQSSWWWSRFSDIAPPKRIGCAPDLFSVLFPIIDVTEIRKPLVDKCNGNYNMVVNAYSTYGTYGITSLILVILKRKVGL